ncbi:MAG: FKBP-type peptidyl-prolyl cis-trans isomerase [Nanobdellota archaeon]
MTIQKGDFIELDYTGKVHDDENMVFDTTVESVAKKEEIYSEKTTYKPTLAIVGEGHLIQGLDKRLEGIETGTHTFEIPAEEAFGKKDAKKLQLVPAKVFRKQNIRPMVGLQVNVDDEIGVIRSVSGGRIIVDFNHPLSSKDVVYDVDIKRIITDNKERLDRFFELMGLPYKSIDVSDNKAIVHTTMQFPPEMVKQITEDLKRLTKLDSISFQTESSDTTSKKDNSQTNDTTSSANDK